MDGFATVSRLEPNPGASAPLLDDELERGVPFRLVGGANPLILLPAYVNGAGPNEFILDTGAVQCLLSPELAASLAIEAESEQDAIGAGGAIKVGCARVRSLAVGAVRRLDVEVAITGELARVGAAIGARIDGDLGFNFMKDFRVTVDYERQVVRFAPASETSGADGVPPHSVPFQLAAAKPLIVVPARANGEGPFSFALDTGASRSFLSPELARRLGVATVEERAATGAGGAVRVSAGRLTSLAVGGAYVRDHAIAVGDFLPAIGTAAGAELDGIVGYNFLREFQVTIDYPRARLELLPAAVR